MRILVHICCGPCGITVLQRLQDAGHTLAGLFFNPNIHPLAEYMRRREGAFLVAERLGIPLFMGDELPEEQQDWVRDMPEGTRLPKFAPGTASHPVPTAANPAFWLRAVAGSENDRCVFCWRVRMQKTAELARARDFDGFTSSLLYSRYQNHEAISELGQELATAWGIAFVYQDFRTSWQEGVDLSKEWDIYRQQYCGCLFSEYERYSRNFSRVRKKGYAEGRPRGGEDTPPEQG